MIRMIRGDIFTSRMRTLVNPVNCVGVMGKGLALQFKNRYPEMFEDYRARCFSLQVKPGKPYIYKHAADRWILNFSTKRHWRDASPLEDIDDGLDAFIARYQEWRIDSIAFPPLGCGCGGLAWHDVRGPMTRKIGQLEISVEIYAPFR